MEVFALNEALQTKSQKWALPLFMIGVFMAALDNGIISAALTTINDAYEVKANWGAWGVTIYTLGLAISVPIVGKLSDRYGRKKLFLLEIALFGLGSLMVALSPTFTIYLISRLIQALGGGGIFIIASAHILSTLPKEKQGKALGALGGVNGIASLIGPNLGSILLDLTGNWHLLFLINIPIAIILLYFGFTKLSETTGDQQGKIDLAGTILLSLSILAIMYGLTNLEGADIVASILQPSVYGFVLGGIVLFIALLMHEARVEKTGGDPILPFNLLKQPPYLLTLLIGAFSGALLASMIFIPAFTEQVLGIEQSKSGYWMTPLAIAAGIGAGMGGALTDKRGPMFTVFLSGIISLIGFFLFPLWIDSLWTFVISSFVAGFGIGIILGAPLNILATESISKDQGSALASLSLARQLGMTIAPTIYAGFIARSYNDLPNLFAEELPTKLQENIGNANLSAEAQAEFSQLMSSISADTNMTELANTIQNAELKEVIFRSVNDVTKIASENGYDGLFLSAGFIAVFIVIVGLILLPIRKKSINVKSE
jgi:EmrB/QacA subfamily drug resistance transporter